MNTWFKKFREGLFTRTQVITGITLTAIGATTFVYAFQLLTLHSFTPGTPISSAQVNQNFQALNQALASLPIGFSVGLNNSLTIPSSMGATTLAFETVHYDFTEGSLGVGLVNSDQIFINENGYYQIVALNRSAAGDGQINILVGGSTMQSIFLNTMGSLFPNNQYVPLNSGDIVTIEINSGCCSDLELDPELFKLKFIKF
jgi:hypothetical protein